MKKYAPYILILIILVGLLGPMRKANAFACTSISPIAPTGCTLNVSQELELGGMKANGTSTATPTVLDPLNTVAEVTTGVSTLSATPPATAAEIAAAAPKSDFETLMTGKGCMTGVSNANPLSDGCIKKLFYWFFHDIPAFLLYVSAYFFNVLLSVSLSSDLLKSSFVGQAWGIVRDLSNIFFILILLYIAIKIILGLGGSEVKKMIAKVIIIALLINFSMFFTEIIIDSSNILALIFYNKTTVNTKNPNGEERIYSGIGNEKDVAGGLVNSFDPTKMVGQEFFTQAAKKFDANGAPMTEKQEVPLGMILSVILLSGAVMCVAIYAFFVSGFFFLGRLIELWILIIFSPFAFISSTVPQLSSIEDIGWQAWFKRLLSSAFMAPIFMFFLYFIFMLVSNKAVFESIIPKSTTNDGITGTIKMILGVILPSILICVLLLKAKNYAKKGSGAIGEMVLKGAKMAGGLALGAATGGAALGLSGKYGLGGLASKIASGKGLNKAAKKDTLGGMAARMALGTAKYGSKATFDVRKIAGVGALAKMGGINLEAAKGIGLGSKEGGYQQRRTEQVEKRKKRAKDLEVGEDESMKQDLNKTEMKLQTLLSTNAQEITNLDKTIEKARQEATDAERDFKAGTITKDQFKKKTDDVQTALMDKKEFMAGRGYMAKDSSGKLYMKEGTGENISELEKLQKTQAQAIKTENVDRRQKYAERIVKYGLNDIRTDREAAHKIITEVKLDSGTKT